MRFFLACRYSMVGEFALIRVPFLVLLFVFTAISHANARDRNGAESCLSVLTGSSRLDQRAAAPPFLLKDGANGVPLRFVYKQADRKSSNSKDVAYARLDNMESGPDSTEKVLVLLVDDVSPDKPNSKAWYKAALTMQVRQANRDIVDHAFDDGVLELSSTFSMRVDSAVSSFKAKAPVLFHQFWQGAPYHPALSLAIVSDKDVPAGEKETADAHARFELRIANDEHSPSSTFETELIRHDLGPLEADQWIRWEVKLALDSKGRGAIEVLRDGVEVWRESGLQVGFDSRSPQYKPDRRPNRMISNVDLMIYRANWAGRQSIRFRRFSLCAS